MQIPTKYRLFGVKSQAFQLGNLYRTIFPVVFPTNYDAAFFWLPGLDTFRTLHWAKIRQQIISLGIAGFLLTAELSRKGRI